MRGPSRKPLAATLLALGVAAIVVGALGLGLDWGQSSHHVAAAGSPTPTPTATSAQSSAASSNASSSVPPAREQPAAFLTAYTAALRGGNTTLLEQRLHSVVVARYGSAACTTAVGQLLDPKASLTLLGVAGPAPFDYRSDGKSVVVPNVYSFNVSGTVQGSTGPRTYHFALVDGRFRSFLDCGTPLPGAP